MAFAPPNVGLMKGTGPKPRVRLTQKQAKRGQNLERQSVAKQEVSKANRNTRLQRQAAMERVQSRTMKVTGSPVATAARGGTPVRNPKPTKTKPERKASYGATPRNPRMRG